MTTLSLARGASQAGTTANIRDAMRTHRANTPTIKRPVHPGLTQQQAGFTPSERRWLLGGVCEGLSAQTERGERLANWTLAALTLLLLLAIGAGVLNDHWAEKEHVQTVQSVEAGR